MKKKKLSRSAEDRWLSGVLGGFGDYFDVDPLILRIGFIIFLLLTGIFPGVVIYVIAAMLIPEAPRTMPHERLTDADFQV